MVETIILMIMAAGACAFDAFTALAGFIPLVGQVLIFSAIAVDFVVFSIIELWLIMKGGWSVRKQSAALVGNLLSEIPFLNAIPFRLVGLAVSIYMINHPKIASLAGAAKPTA